MAVAIPTYERPVLLRKSTVPHLKDGSEVRIYDSSSVATCNENKDMLRTAEREFRTKIRYGAARELGIFVRQLVKEFDPGLVKFALEEGAGSARNRILLDTHGDKVLMCDDDVVAGNRRASDSSKKLFRKASGLRRDPLGFKGDASLESAQSRVRTLPKGSNASQALSLLGKKAETVWSEERNNASVVGDRLVGPVVALQVGWVGRAPASAWGNEGSLRGGAGLWKPADGSFTRVTELLTYQAADFLRTFYLGLDNSLELPPFFPLEKSGSGPTGESCYGEVLSACVPGVAVFLPELVLHETDAPARGMVLPWTCVVSMIAGESASATELAERLASAQNVEERISELEGRLQSEMDSRRAALSNSPFGKANVPSVEVKIQRPTDQEAKTLFQYGALIKAWPDMLRAAKMIRENGVTLTYPL